jgi:hypothetical protein
LLASRKPTNAGENMGERNPYIQLIEMKTSTITMKISMKVPQKTKNTLTL